MSDVNFNEENSWRQNQPAEGANSKLVNMILKTGLVKDPQKANLVLAGIAVVFFVITVSLFFSAGSSSPNIVPPPAEPENILPEDRNQQNVSGEEGQFEVPVGE